MSAYDEPTIEAQLDGLKKQREAVKQKIKEKDQELSSGKKEQEENKNEEASLTERIAALERAQSDITKVQEQVTKMREALSTELGSVGKLCEAVEKGLAKVDEDYLAQVREARGEVDGEIAKLKEEAAELEKKVKPAEAAAESARKVSRESDAALAAAQEKLRNLPAEIQAAKAELMTIKSAMDNAYSKGPLTQAFLQMLDLEVAIEKISNLIADDTVKNQVQQVQDLSRKAREDKAEFEKASRELETLKADLAKKEKDASDALTRRKTEINNRVIKIVHPDSKEPAPAVP